MGKNAGLFHTEVGLEGNKELATKFVFEDALEIVPEVQVLNKVCANFEEVMFKTFFF